MTGFRVVLCLFLVMAGISSARADAPVPRNKLPIQIKSNELLTDSPAHTATFIGKVSAKQGDVTIYSDKLVIHYSPSDQDVDRVEAFGNVHIVQENRVGEGEHGVYESRTGKVTLDGNPKVVQGRDVITGNVITYFVDEQKSVVTSAPGKRVDAVIHPKDRDKDRDKDKSKDSGKNDPKP